MNDNIRRPVLNEHFSKGMAALGLAIAIAAACFATGSALPLWAFLFLLIIL